MDAGVRLVGVIREYLKLIRPYGILFIGLTPVFGALCNGTSTMVHLSLLLVIGLLGHVFVFVQNDYYDIDVDRQSTYVLHRPLTAESITRTQARLLYLCSFLLSILLTGIFFFSIPSFIVLLASFLLMTLYNRYSKRIPGMEYTLGAAVFLYGLFGALTVSDLITPLAVIISSLCFLQWVFSVGISANLKDVEFDTKLGIRTTPVMLGVHVEGNDLKKPLVFLFYTSMLKMVHLLVALLPFILGYTSFMVAGYPIPLLGFCIIACILFLTTRGILTTSIKNRARMLRYEGAHEGLALLLIPFVLLSLFVESLGILLTVLLITTLILWPLLILWVLYGKTLIPLE
jgi:4-hydroxybenzoate polyprenyltransferase